MSVDIRFMRVLFYIGAMLILIGMGIAFMNERIIGAIIICVGAAFLVIGFAGIRFCIAVERKIKRKQKEV